MKRLVVKIAGEVHLDLDDEAEQLDMEELAQDLFDNANAAEMDLKFDGFYVEEV